MQTTRITVNVPNYFYEDLRLLAYEQRKSISSLFVERAMQDKVKNLKTLQKDFDDDISFFRKVAKMGVKINAAQAVREERDRDNA